MNFILVNLIYLKKLTKKYNMNKTLQIGENKYELLEIDTSPYFILFGDKLPDFDIIEHRSQLAGKAYKPIQINNKYYGYKLIDENGKL